MNDMVLVMVNGCVENECLMEDYLEWLVFKKVFLFICEDLVKEIVRDGEGVIKLIEV